MRKIAATMLLLGGLLGTLAGCGPRGEDALVRARAALARHDDDAALVLLKQWLQQQPESGEGRYLLGRLLLDRHETAAALIELGKAGELGQPPALTAPAMARALLQRGEPKRVLQLFAATTLADAPAQADLSTSLATAYFALKQDAPGQAALQHALEAAPDHLPARLLQVRRLAAGGDRDGALALLEQAGLAAVRDPAAWMLRGHLLEAPPVSADHAASAVVAYRQALQLGGDGLQAHAAILTLLIAQNDLDAAQAQLAQLRKLRPAHPQTLYFDTVLALRRGQAAAARASADKLLASAPTEAAYQRLAGTAALEAGDLPRAAAQLTAALQTVPGDKSLRRLLTLVHLRSGESARALATVQPLLGAQPPDAEAMALAAMAELQNGQPARARALFAAASRLAPGDARVRSTLAMGRLASGEGDAALADLQRLAAADTGTEADIALVRAHMQRRRWDQALAALDALARKPAGALPALMLRGELQVRRGDLAMARAQYDKAAQLAPEHFPATAALAELDLLQQRPADARARFEALLARNPRNRAALIAQASLGALTGRPRDEVAGLLGQAIEAEPGQPGARLLLIDHHLAHGDAKAALDVAGKAVLALPEDARLQEALARTNLAAGDLSQAVRAYTRLVAMQPGAVAPLLGLAHAQMVLKDPEAARRAIHQALKAQPDSTAALGDLVHLELSLQRPKEAAAVAHRVQSLHPDDAQGDVLEAEVLARQSAWAGAEAAYGRALRKRGDTGAAARALHRLLRNQGKTVEARQFASGWVQAHPRDIAFQVHLGEDSLTRGDLAGAEAGFAAVLKLRPDDAQALNNLAWVGLKLDRDGALALAERACALRPDTPTYLDTLAQLQARGKQLELALATQRRAIALAPEDGQLRLTLARLYASAGERSKAVAELDRLAALGERFPGQAQVARLRQSL